MSLADIVWVDLLFAEEMAFRVPLSVGSHGKQIAFVLALQVCINLNSPSMDFDTEFHLTWELMKYESELLVLVGDAKEVARKITVIPTVDTR